MHKKIIISLCFLSTIGSAQFSGASRYRLKGTNYNWVGQLVPTNAFLDSTFLSFYNRYEDRAFLANSISSALHLTLTAGAGTGTTSVLKISQTEGVYSSGRYGDIECTVFGSLAAITSTGTNNSAFGRGALYLNVSGTDNTAIGNTAMLSNSTGLYNNALGKSALFSNVSGSRNNAFGYFAAFASTASDNCAFGDNSLRLTTTGGGNCGFGTGVLHDNTTGALNVAIGTNAGYTNTSGIANSYLSAESGIGITSGNFNTIAGANVGNPPNAALTPTLTNNIIWATGQGTIRYQFDATFHKFNGTIKPQGASAGAGALFNLPITTAPVSPSDGDIWREDNTNTGLKIRINGVTKTIAVQ